jgi:hypothetical protein
MNDMQTLNYFEKCSFSTLRTSRRDETRIGVSSSLLKPRGPGYEVYSGVGI